MENSIESIDETTCLLNKNDQRVELPQTMKLLKNKTKFRIEPGLFVLFLGLNLSITITTNQILIQTCIVTFEQDQTDCLLIGTNNESTAIQVILYRVFIIWMSYSGWTPKVLRSLKKASV